MEFSHPKLDPRVLQAAQAAAAAAAAAASTSSAAPGPSGLPSGMVMDEATKNAMQYFLNQQYEMQQMQANVNDTFNLTQNAIASGIPTLDKPTIMSYLGYNQSLQPSGSNSKENFSTKYSKLMDVIGEIGECLIRFIMKCIWFGS